MKILLVIAARGGSKGIKNKNLLKINGNSLTYITLKKTYSYKKFTKIVLTSDSNKILKEADSFPGVIKIKRPKFLASDKANIFLAVDHVLKEIKNKTSWYPDVILLTTPTTPLKKLSHFSKCMKLMKKKEISSVITIREPDYPTHWMLKKKGLQLKNIIKGGNKYKRRQDTPKTYQPAGTVYAFNINILRDLIKNKKIFPLNNTRGVVVSRKESINIDNIEDYYLAKYYGKKKNFIFN
jgi:CMP-N,N'-diacetyllegionaminic acid synthase